MKKGLHTRGFTLAEILITLVIIGFVAALGVPMLGQKRVQKPTLDNGFHGTMECFYTYAPNASGSGLILNQFTSDNVDDKNGTLQTSNGTFCTFTAPVASRFVFQVIGPGEGGDDMNGRTPETYQENPVESGEIPVDNTFKRSIESEDVPDWVREYWNDQWLNGNPDVKPVYKITTPIGWGGKGICQHILINQESTAELNCTTLDCNFGLSDCPLECFDTKSASGGASGKQGYVKIRAKKIEYYSDKAGVEYKRGTDYTQLNLNDSYVRLAPSGDGSNATYDNNRQIAQPGGIGRDWSLSSSNNVFYYPRDEYEWIAYGSTYLQNPGFTAEQACNKEHINQIRALGDITIESSDTISYSARVLGLRARFQLAGKPGLNVTKMFESIPAGTEFRLYPGHDMSGGSRVSRVAMKDENGNWQTLLEAGQDGSVEFADERGRVLNKTLPITSEDLPFFKKYYPDAFIPLSPSIMVSSANGYRSNISDRNITPGKSGGGTFKPYTDSINGYSDYRINGVSVGNVNENRIEYDGGFDSLDCPDGSTWSDVGSYCQGQLGRGGAIIISW